MSDTAHNYSYFGMIRESLRYGIRTIIHHPIVLLKGVIVALLCWIGIPLIVLIALNALFLPTTGQIICIILALPFMLGGAYIGFVQSCLQLLDQGTASLNRLFPPTIKIGRIIAAFIIKGLLTVAVGIVLFSPTLAFALLTIGKERLQMMVTMRSFDGLLGLLFGTSAIIFLLIIVIGGFALSQDLYLIADSNIGVIDALKRSWSITKGRRSVIFLFYVITNVLLALLTRIFNIPMGTNTLSIWAGGNIVVFISRILYLVGALFIGLFTILVHIRFYRLLVERAAYTTISDTSSYIA